MTLLDTAEYIEVIAGVRYWEDATVNGEEDTDGNLIPFRRDDMWNPIINLADGQIVGWPQGMTADVHYKVCDEGVYYLLDAHKQNIAKYRSYYVPNSFLCHGDNGYGDYIIFSVDENGKIKNYRKPEIIEEQWEWAEE